MDTMDKIDLKESTLLDAGVFDAAELSSASKLFGQAFKMLVAVIAVTRFPSCIHDTYKGERLDLINQMALVKSTQDRRNRYSLLLRNGWLKKVGQSSYMLNPSVFFIGTPDQKQKAIEQYERI